MMNVYSQIVFTLEDDRRTYAIDEVNQRAYLSFKYDASVIEGSYVHQNQNIMFNSQLIHYVVPVCTKHIGNMVEISLIHFLHIGGLI